MLVLSVPVSAVSALTSHHPHPLAGVRPVVGCEWWNLLCQGGHKLADSGLSAITQALGAGAAMLMGQITKIIDASTQVPLADPTYRHIYTGFAALAVPLVAVVLLGALVVAGFRRDAATFGRAVVGVVVACVGGALFIVFAQLLVATDNWLAHGIVTVTGHDITDGVSRLSAGFDHIAGGEAAANMLLIILMGVMLIAGVVLWLVLVLRQIGILVVVAFAPLLIAGWLWGPTRSWVRRATETLVALVFTKSAIYALFGIGLALLSHGAAGSFANFVAMIVLLCGACFAPLVMLKLVHFAADSHLAGQMMGGLGQGARTAGHHAHRAASVTKTMGRSDMARSHATSTQSNQTSQAGQTSGGQGRMVQDSSGGSGSGGTASGPGGAGGGRSGTGGPGGSGGGGSTPTPGGSPGSGSGGSGGGAAAGAGAVVGGTAKAAKAGIDTAQRAGQSGGQGAERLTGDASGPGGSTRQSDTAGSGSQQWRMSGPTHPGDSTNNDTDSDEGNR